MTNNMTQGISLLLISLVQILAGAMIWLDSAHSKKYKALEGVGAGKAYVISGFIYIGIFYWMGVVL